MVTKSKIVKPDPYVKAHLMPVAEYIERMIDISGKTQIAIAKEVGFEKPNVITMIKQGKTRLPMGKIGRFAIAIGVDPVHLYQMCMQEYEPENWEEIKGLLKQPPLTANEIEMIAIIREANPDDPAIFSDQDKAALAKWAAGLKTKSEISSELHRARQREAVGLDKARVKTKR